MSGTFSGTLTDATGATFDATLTLKPHVATASPGPVPVASPDNAQAISPATVLVTADLAQWRLAGAPPTMTVQWMPKGGAWAAAGSTAAVTRLMTWGGRLFHTSPNASSLSTPGWWRATVAGTTVGWGEVPGNPSLPVVVMPPPAPGTGFHVTTSGFIGPDGKPWVMRGLNGGVNDALQMAGNVFAQFPRMTCWRLNTGGNDSAADIDRVVKAFNAKNVVVEIEDHSGNANNVAWYQQMATAYKGNPMVFLEMPNEPNGNNLTNIQIGLVKAIRAAGFTNPVALQPVGGYDFSNIGGVLSQIDKTNIFITPHIYYSGGDPNGAQSYLNADISQCLNNGCFPAIDEFGEAMDGWNWDQYGATVTSSIIAANQAGRCGALYWAANNGAHSNGADSAFVKADASQLSPTGAGPLKGWIG
jgi:hypothetical protein